MADEARCRDVRDAGRAAAKLGTAVVLSCSERLRTIIGSDCGELIRCGVKLAGRYVSQLATAKDPMLDGSLKLSGRVIGLDGADLLLDDNGDGPARLPTSEAFLEPTRANFEAVVEALTQGSAARLLGAIEVAEGQWRAGDLVRARVEAAFDYLRRAGLFVARGMPSSWAMFSAAHRFLRRRSSRSLCSHSTRTGRSPTPGRRGCWIGSGPTTARASRQRGHGSPSCARPASGAGWPRLSQTCSTAFPTQCRALDSYRTRRASWDVFDCRRRAWNSSRRKQPPATPTPPPRGGPWKPREQPTGHGTLLWSRSGGSGRRDSNPTALIGPQRQPS